MSEKNEYQRLKATVAACWVIGGVLALAVIAIVNDQIGYASGHLFDGVGAHPKSWDAWHTGGSSVALFFLGLLGVINTIVLIGASISKRKIPRND